VNDFTLSRSLNGTPVSGADIKYDVTLDMLINVNDATFIRSLNGLNQPCN
jgi:hypothetical protein